MKNQKVMTPEKVEEITEQLFVTPTEKKKPVLKNIKLEKLRPFKDHPYKVQDNDLMDELEASIADALGITPEYLCYVFKQCEKTTVMAYVNRIKLESIRSLMEKENLPLCKAAEFFGYSDPNYVSRLYKKLFQSNITDSLLKNKPKNTPI